MKITDELRKQQIAITADFKARSQKAEKILGQITACEEKLATLNKSLSTVLLLEVIKAAAGKFPKRKSAKAAKVKKAKVKIVKPTITAKPAAAAPTATKPPAGKSIGPTLKDSVRDFMLKAGKPMKIAEIVKACKRRDMSSSPRNPAQRWVN